MVDRGGTLTLYTLSFEEKSNLLPFWRYFRNDVNELHFCNATRCSDRLNDSDVKDRSDIR